VREAARWLAGAERPVIVVDRMARTPAGMKSLIELAELLNAAVIDQTGRQNFPNTHYLWQADGGGKLIRQADVLLCLELTDLWGTVNQYVVSEVAGKPKLKPETKVISINANDLSIKPNYQYFQRFQPADIAMAADAEATMPSLIEAVKAALTADRKTAIAGRAAAFRKAHADAYEASRQAATLGWDASPVSTARMCMELWPLIKDEDWSIVSVGAAPFFMGNWAHRLSARLCTTSRWAGSRSIFSATAISCMRRARCGPRPIITFRC
jgi:thiamine pyrophosphate-dependent acetolactate synthase large subunit-like protein